MQRHEHAGARLDELGRQPGGALDRAARAHEPLHRGAGERHVRIRAQLEGRQVVLRLVRVLLAVDARGHGGVAFLALHLEGGHGVPHAERALVAQKLVRERHALQNAGHDLERTQPAFGGRLEKSLVEAEEPFQVARVQKRHQVVVEHGAFRRIAVGALGQKLVGQVSAREEHARAAQVAGGLRHAPPHGAVVGRREAGKADAHQAVAAVELVHEMQRHERAVVQVPVVHAAAADGDCMLARARAHRSGELGIVGHVHGFLHGAEGAHVAVGGIAR